MDALDIGFAIKNRRAQLGLTQEQVAQAAGVSKRCLWSLELGQNPGVQFNKLSAVLNALGLSLEINQLDMPNTSEGKSERHNVRPTNAASVTSQNKPAQQFHANKNDGVFDALAILTGATNGK